MNERELFSSLPLYLNLCSGRHEARDPLSKPLVPLMHTHSPLLQDSHHVIPGDPVHVPIHMTVP